MRHSQTDALGSLGLIVRPLLSARSCSPPRSLPACTPSARAQGTQLVPYYGVWIQGLAKPTQRFDPMELRWSARPDLPEMEINARTAQGQRTGLITVRLHSFTPRHPGGVTGADVSTLVITLVGFSRHSRHRPSAHAT